MARIGVEETQPGVRERERREASQIIGITKKSAGILNQLASG